jgi:Icc-related predicted phosphoesterase
MSVLDWIIDKIIDRITHNGSYIAPSECLYVPAAHDRFILVNKTNLPYKPPNVTRLVVVSDTHGMHAKLGEIPQGDVFIHCGDILMVGRLFSQHSQEQKLSHFNEWLLTVPCKHKVVIAGNHDELILKMGEEKTRSVLSNAIYLENTGVELCGLSFWGSPWSELKMNSSNRAFQNGLYPQAALCRKPDKVDVLVTHGHCPELVSSVGHKLHLWGHAHHSFGVRFAGETFRNTVLERLSVCAAVPGSNYSLANGPIVVDVLCDDSSVTTEPPAGKVEELIQMSKKGTILSSLKGIIFGNRVVPIDESR